MVRALQQSCRSITVVGSSTESVDVPKGLNKNSPHVAIISADLKDGRSAGFQIVREVRVAYPHIRIILLVESPEPALIVEGFRAGADGAFSRAEPFEMLCKCIHAGCQGQIWASSEDLRFSIEAMAQKDAHPTKNASGTRLLTQKEADQLQLLPARLSN